MGIGLSYTQPRPNLSYDGQEIRVLKISTPVKPEPIVIISNNENPLHIAAAEVRESILKLGKELLSALGINKKGPIAGPLLISRQD